MAIKITYQIKLDGWKIRGREALIPSAGDVEDFCKAYWDQIDDGLNPKINVERIQTYSEES